MHAATRQYRGLHQLATYLHAATKTPHPACQIHCYCRYYVSAWILLLLESVDRGTRYYVEVPLYPACGFLRILFAYGKLKLSPIFFASHLACSGWFLKG
jgi:hypothetical protein